MGYEDAYKALLAKRQAAAQTPTVAPSEEEYMQVAGQKQLGGLLNDLFKSQALMGSVGGKPTEQTGIDNTQYANNNLAELQAIAKRAAEQSQEKRANESHDMGMKTDQQKFDFNTSANPLKLTGMQQDVDFNGAANPLKLQGMKQDVDFTQAANPLKLQGMSLNNQGQSLQNSFASQSNPLKLQGMRNDNQMDNFKLQDATADRSYSPEASRVREQLLQAQKQQMIAQGGNPTSIDQELATLGKAQKIYETAQAIETTDPQKAAQLRQKLNDVISPNKARRLEDLESPIYKSMKQENKAPTEGQSAAALYGTRAEEAAKQMDALESAGYSPSGLSKMVTNNSMFPNFLKSSENQQQDQAQRNFINATLRRESGASIAPSEFDSGTKQYFIQPGDKPEVIAQKKQNVRTAVAGLKAAAGNNALNNIQAQKGTSAPMAAPAAAATPSKEDAIAELRRRGLIK
jgi:hypothetical protein